ncbi:MAG: urate hydroxylase PuuD [Rhodocyclaceae bacterium]|nr:urate hydroxylase PuuD [Rhodocyclaceae bacterium]MBX3669883.1 urate hydroxylase PuuD [Rhodocyclaceae bacterium]
MSAYLVDWLNLLLRWLHLIAGIAWIGASFYFVMLDNSLKPPQKPDDRRRGVFGELWAVHGGGFYCSQKFLAGPQGEALSDDLHWSKWEAYTTWLSGMGLLTLIYWHGAASWLIDKSVLDLAVPAAVAISAALLAGGWLIYDALCRLLEGRENLLAALLFVLVTGAAWGLFHLFAARAAYLHLGAMLGTIMAANVFVHIIPGQKRMVADIRAGRTPSPRPGQIGKQRSVHNTYFTLPVLFVMISGHYPMTYGHPYGWAVLVAIMLAGVLIRQFFVLRHRGQVRPVLPLLACALLAALAVAIAPAQAPARATAAAVSFAQVQAVLARRCLACHATHPTQPGFARAPKGVVLERPEQIAAHATKIGATVASKYMPLGNLTAMSDEERGLIADWVAQGATADQNRP